MSKHSKAAKVPPIDQAGVERAQRRVRQAIRALIKANAAVPMSRQLNALYVIEDELWQYATSMKGE
jgi:hypothetical protein